jgi:hypothetical protein
MKRFLKYSAIFFLLLCVFLPGRFVIAATDAEQAAACSANGGTPQFDILTGAYHSCTPKPDPNATGTCNLNPVGPPFSLSACIYGGLAQITKFIYGAMALLLWLAGSMLDWVLNYTIIQMSANIGAMTGINIVWKVIRDLANIAFIFILLYEAILLIISKSSTEKIKGIVAGIVITALLINFSLFFTKIIIDASNVVTVGFYQSIVGASPPVTPASTGSNTFVIPPGISGAFINDLHVVNFVGSQDVTHFNVGQDDKSITMVALGGSILFLVLSFVFFAISIMYLMRYIVLVVLLMSAPLGYLGFGLPPLKSTQSSWWSTLIGQCIFAPLWMFCCWAILTLVGAGGFLTLSGGASLDTLSAKGALSDLASGVGGVAAPSGIPLVVNFALIIGLVIGSLTLAKKYSGQGAGKIGDWTGKATAFAGGAIMGGAAVAGRNSIGRLANAAANNEKLKGAAANNVFARAALKASTRTANSTFDARNTKAVGQATGALGMNIGKGTKDTLRTVQKAKAEKEAKFAETLKPSEEAAAKNKKAAEEKEKETEALRKDKKNLEASTETEEFKNKREKELNDHLNSSDYKNSDLYKKAEAERIANEAKLKPEKEKEVNLAKELDNLKKNASSRAMAVGKKQADAEIATKEQEVVLHKKELDRVTKEIDQNNTATTAEEEYKKKWKNAEQLDIESKIKDLETGIAESTEASKAIRNIYADRVEAYAKNLEGGQHHMLKYLGAIGGGVAGVALGSPVLAAAGAGYLGYRAYTHATNWKGDRQAAAAKVRKLAKQKTEEEEFAEAAEKLAKKQAKEKEKKENGGGTPETPPATPPASATPKP